MKMILTAVFEEVPEAEGGGYPGAISEGDTLEEARENLRDAIAILLEANRELNSKSPTRAKSTREQITVSLA